MKNSVILAVLLIVIGWVFYTFKITEVPPGINGDEATIGYNAALVARTGRDSEGRFMPLFTKNPNSSDWKQPITFYAEILAFRLFEPSYFNLRVVSVFFVLISGTLIFLLIKELLGFKASILGLLIFATTPIVMIQSHLALENIAPIPFIALWLWMLAKYTKKQESKYLILAGLSLGISLYSYLGLRIIMPVLGVMSVIYIFYISRTKNVFINLLFFIITLLPFLVILLLVKNQYPGAILGQYRPYNIISYQQLILPYISSFDPSFLFISGDITPYHSTGKHGVFLLVTLPLFVLGIIKIIRKNNSVLNFILGVFFLSPLLFGFGSDIHRGSRLLILIPSYVVITVFGFEVLLDFKNRLKRALLSGVAMLLILLNYTDFLSDYWYQYPNRVKSDFAQPIHVIFEKAHKISKERNLKPFIRDDIPPRNQIATDFFEYAYFPGGLSRWKESQKIPEDSVIIISSSTLSQNLEENVQVWKDKESEFALLINR